MSPPENGQQWPGTGHARASADGRLTGLRGGSASARLDEPVIVLTGARSGSTLLRLILDAHPQLACPPETNIVKLCNQLGAVWCTLDPACTPQSLSKMAVASMRAMLNTVFTDLLMREGKVRWCDKSLGTVSSLEPFHSLYPKAKFICLYRHCMDMIDSGLEASPFGLMGYGFERYVTRFEGNSIAALAAYWAEHTGRQLDFESAHPGKCHRVYYEELVSSPERVAQDLFAFIGVDPAPGLTDGFLMASPKLPGPGDHKVRARSRITADSVGRGMRVPVDAMAPPQLSVINSLLGRLGYALVDDEWRRSVRPPALRRHAATAPDAGTSPIGDVALSDVGLLDQMGAVVRERANARILAPLPAPGAGALGPSGRVGIVAYCESGDLTTRCWCVDLGRGSLAEIDVTEGTRLPVDWLVTGDISTWGAVLAGYENFAACLRLRSLRYVSLMEPTGPALVGRRYYDENGVVAIMRHLLALQGEPVEVSRG